MDFNQLLQQFTSAQQSPTTQKLQQMLQNGQLQQLPPDTQDKIRQAANAAAAGNQAAALQMIAQVLATPEGATLAAQIRKALQ